MKCGKKSFKENQDEFNCLSSKPKGQKKIMNYYENKQQTKTWHLCGHTPSIWIKVNEKKKRHV